MIQILIIFYSEGYFKSATLRATLYSEANFEIRERHLHECHPGDWVKMEGCLEHCFQVWPSIGDVSVNYSIGNVTDTYTFVHQISDLVFVKGDRFLTNNDINPD